MFILRLLCVVWLSFFISQTIQTKWSIFDLPKVKCIVDCHGNCKPVNFSHVPDLVYHVDMLDENNFFRRDRLIYGHNGLRNRLAVKLNVADMLALNWNDNLAMLANMHHLSGNREIACNVPKVNYSSLKAPTDIYDTVRNSCFYADLYSPHFFAGALSKWYRMHRKMPSPKIVKIKSSSYYQMNASNPFVNMINPRLSEFGCSFAIFNNGRSLICYYFPYNHTNTEVLLRRKPAMYMCPDTFPRVHKIFKGLCESVF